MAMPNRNIRNIDEDIARIARFLRQAREDVSSSLAAFGTAQCLMALRAATSRTGGHHGTTAGIVISGVGNLWAAGWVAADPARRRATGWIILCASLVPMVIAVGLSDDYNVFFDILREIA